MHFIVGIFNNKKLKMEIINSMENIIEISAIVSQRLSQHKIPLDIIKIILKQAFQNQIISYDYLMEESDYIELRYEDDHRSICKGCILPRIINKCKICEKTFCEDCCVREIVDFTRCRFYCFKCKAKLTK